MGKARNLVFDVEVQHVKKGWKMPFKLGVVRVTWPNCKFWEPPFENGWNYDLQNWYTDW